MSVAILVLFSRCVAAFLSFDKMDIALVNSRRLLSSVPCKTISPSRCIPAFDFFNKIVAVLVDSSRPFTSLTSLLLGIFSVRLVRIRLSSRWITVGKCWPAFVFVDSLTFAEPISRASLIWVSCSCFVVRIRLSSRWIAEDKYRPAFVFADFVTFAELITRASWMWESSPCLVFRLRLSSFLIDFEGLWIDTEAATISFIFLTFGPALSDFLVWCISSSFTTLCFMVGEYDFTWRDLRTSISESTTSSTDVARFLRIRLSVRWISFLVEGIKFVGISAVTLSTIWWFSGFFFIVRFSLLRMVGGKGGNDAAAVEAVISESFKCTTLISFLGSAFSTRRRLSSRLRVNFCDGELADAFESLDELFSILFLITFFWLSSRCITGLDNWNDIDVATTSFSFVVCFGRCRIRLSFRGTNILALSRVTVRLALVGLALPVTVDKFDFSSLIFMLLLVPSLWNRLEDPSVMTGGRTIFRSVKSESLVNDCRSCDCLLTFLTRLRFSSDCIDSFAIAFDDLPICVSVVSQLLLWSILCEIETSRSCTFDASLTLVVCGSCTFDASLTLVVCERKESVIFVFWLEFVSNFFTGLFWSDWTCSFEERRGLENRFSLESAMLFRWRLLEWSEPFFKPFNDSLTAANWCSLSLVLLNVLVNDDFAGW